MNIRIRLPPRRCFRPARPTISRRDALKATIATVGLSALGFEPARAAETAKPDPRRGSPKRHEMRKSINTKKGTDYSLETFRPLLDGTTNWPAVTEALDQTGYRGFLTFEYFHPYAHYPEALIYQTSDSLDRILGRKA